MSREFWRPARGAIAVAHVLFWHVALAALIMFGIWALKWIYHQLWHDGDPLVFDLIPLRYVFHAMDMMVLANFLWYGSVEVAEAFRER
jgi:hypothetical protein